MPQEQLGAFPFGVPVVVNGTASNFTAVTGNTHTASKFIIRAFSFDGRSDLNPIPIVLVDFQGASIIRSSAKVV